MKRFAIVNPYAPEIPAQIFEADAMAIRNTIVTLYVNGSAIAHANLAPGMMVIDLPPEQKIIAPSPQESANLASTLKLV